MSLGLGIFFLLLYTLTLSPDLLPADAGEFQLVGAVLGVAHPPGFALYTLLGWLISRLPVVAPATAINFLSALIATLTIVLLSRAVQHFTGSRLAGLCAALALGFSTTFWAQATTANIRMLTAFATALALDRLSIYRSLTSRHPSTALQSAHALRAGAVENDQQLERALSWVALALGLGVSHHASLFFVAAVLGLYTLWLRPSVLRRPLPLLAAALPFLAWLYFPLRAGAFGAPPRIATLDGFLEHVLARGFSGDLFYFANLADLPDRILVWSNILTFEFTWPLLVLTVLGGAAALRRERPLGIALLSALAMHTFVAITYKAPQTVEYLMPAYVLMAALLGFGFAVLFHLPKLIGQLATRSRPHAHTPTNLEDTKRAHGARGEHIFRLALLLTALILGAQFLMTFPSYRMLARDTSTRDYAGYVLAAAPPQAVILAAWHWATPLWYLQNVEGQRPDVEVRYVFPRGESLARTWADEVDADLPTRPVVVTSFYPTAYEALPYRFLPLGPAWEVRAGPLTVPPDDLIGSMAFGDWTFLGYRLESSSGSGEGVPSVALTAAWQIHQAAAPQDISFFVHLLGPDGQPHGQMDVSHPASRYVPGEVLLDRYTIALRPETPPGKYALVAGAYRPDGTRLAEAPLTTIDLARPPASPVRIPSQSILLGDWIVFTGAGMSPAGPLRPGDSLTVALHFLAVRPITRDYVVKVDLIGQDGRWRVQSDGIPAGGAIPTLKWIAGSRVTDRHTLAVPADAGPGTADLVLAVYDSFTQQTLPILEPRLAALSPTVPLGTVEVVGP